MRAAFATFVLSLIAAACAPTPPSEPTSPLPPAAPPEITASCGGGVTGGSEGITIRPDGHIISWRQATAGGQREETDLGPDPVYIADIRHELDAAHFDEVSLSETGNMTCALRKGDHTISWPQGGEDRLPAGIEDAFDLVFTADGRE